MKDTKDFQERYNRWKNGERYWDIRGVELPKYDTGKTSTEKKNDFYSWMDKIADQNAQLVGFQIPQYQHGKNTMNSFITDIGPLVYQGLKSRGVKNPNAYDYMMRQLAMESGYGGTRYRNSHNYGGVMSKGKLKQFESDQQFVDYYLNLMNNKYRDAVSAKDLRQYAEQLGKQGYYNGPTVQQYYDKLNGLKTYGRLLQNDLNKNRSIYEQNSGIQVNPQTNQAQFIQPIPIEQQPAQIPLIKPQDLKMLTVPINQIKIPNLNFK